MPCTDPKNAWVQGLTKNGKPKYIFHHPGTTSAEKHLIPCGKCISCLLDKSKEWATRGQHESQTNKLNSFLTLTYNDEHLPKYGTLVKNDLTKFIKLLRYFLPNLQFKHLSCGEYGSIKQTHRPHYHLCLFGFEPLDKKYYKDNEHGDPMYTSKFISNIWEKGFITISDLNYKTVAYVARYTTKKLLNPDSVIQKDYWIDFKTGETNYDPIAYRNYLITKNKIPEFTSMSRNIGLDWYKKYKQDTLKDYVTVNRIKHKIPKYYDKLLDKENPDELKKIKTKRVQNAKANYKTKQRLRSLNIIKINQLKQLKRDNIK